MTADIIYGTAMGPHHACSYADIAADYAINQKVMALHINPFHSKIKQWSRFRYDIFCIWYGSEKDLLDFDAWLNNLHPRLKFTKDYSTSSIVFLDLRLTISGNQVISGIYSKPSNTHSYLMPTSCHPSHICKNIPRGVMKRVKRNCSSDEICIEGYSKFKQHLIRRGYSSTIVDEAIEQAISTPREVVLGSVNSNDIDTSSKRQFPLVMKFNPKLPPMSHYIHKHFHILQLSSKSTHLFNKRTIFTSYKMERNILSMITKNNFKPPSTLQLPPATRPTLVHTADPNWGCHPCANSCTLCKNFLKPSLTFTSPKTSQTYKIKAHINCNTKNIIYLILDLKCPDIFYVGYTTDCMAVRWRNHKSHIKSNIKSCELAHHFIQFSDTTHKLDKSTQSIYTEQLSKHLAIILIKHIPPDPDKDIQSLLKQWENFWQGALKSTPFFGGINKRCNRRKQINS